MRLWVLTPVFFDCESFRRLHEEVLAVGSSIEGVDDVRCAVIDDSGGIDPAVSGVSELAGVTVVTVPYNVGHQRALAYGLRKVLPSVPDDDMIVTMDADGEDKPSDMPRLVEACRARDGIVVALRTSRETSIPFRVLYVIFRVVFRLLTGLVVRSGNFAVYRASTMRGAIRNPAFDLCYSSALLALPWEITTVPCARGHRYADRSKMSYGRLTIHGLRMLMPFLDRIIMRTTVVFSVVFASGVVGAIGLTYLRLFTTKAIPGWASLSVFSAVSLSFVALGNLVLLFVLFSSSRLVTHLDLEGESG